MKINIHTLINYKADKQGLIFSMSGNKITGIKPDMADHAMKYDLDLRLHAAVVVSGRTHCADCSREYGQKISHINLDHPIGNYPGMIARLNS